MVVFRSLSLSPPRPDTTLSSRAGGLVPTRNFPDKLRYRRRAALGEDRLADLRAGAGWWAWSPLMGCVILAESALEERQVGEETGGKRKEWNMRFHPTHGPCDHFLSEFISLEKITGLMTKFYSARVTKIN